MASCITSAGLVNDLNVTRLTEHHEGVAICIQLPVEEQLQEVQSIRRQHMVLPCGKTLPRGGLDDSEKYFEIGSLLPPLLPPEAGAAVSSLCRRRVGGSPLSDSSTHLGSSHTSKDTTSHTSACPLGQLEILDLIELFLISYGMD